MEKQNSGLLNSEYIKEVMLKNAQWAFSHGATNGYIGLGMFYYSLVYLLHAKIAVCLGSGGGFVPRIIRQAQRDLGIAKESMTFLIDANAPRAGFGAPEYLHPGSFFRTHFPDVELVMKTTKDAANMFKSENIKIDYLHIDADHTLEGTVFDYETYRPFMADKFIITIHDTRYSPGVVKAIERIRLNSDIELIDFNYLSYGVAIVKPK